MSSIIWKAHLGPSHEAECYEAIARWQWPAVSSSPIDLSPPIAHPSSPPPFATVTGTNEHDIVVGGCQWSRRLIHVGPIEVEIAALGGVVLAPEFRGQGLGGSLLQFADDWVAGQGLDWSVLFTSPERVRFYSAAGYSKLEGTVYVTNQGKVGTTEPQTVVMAKSLCEGAKPELASWIHSAIDVGHGQW